MVLGLAWSLPLCAETFRDEFGSVSYSNNDGTANWNGSWVERDDDGLPNGGNVLIAGGVLSLDDNPNTDVDPSAEREADLSPFDRAVFTFDFQTVGGVDPGDSILVEVSDDGGGSWTLMEDITGIGDTAGARSYSLLDHIPALTANTRIRFRVNGLNGTGGTACCYGGAGEQFLVDNAQIEGLCIGPADTFKDEFNLRRYDGSDGSLPWNSPWVEGGDGGGGATGGDIQVLNDVSDYQLRVRDRNNGIEREADLSSYLGATLSLKYRRDSLDDNREYVTVQVSPDGGANWFDLDQLGGPATDTQYVDWSADISAYMAANTRIRFRSSNRMRNDDVVWFDDVQIAANRAVSCGAGPSPVGEWRLDESSWDGTPGEVVDSIGNGLNGRRIGSATPVPAKVCNGASLNGSTDYLEIGDSPLLDITDELTVTVWINPDLIPSGGSLKTIVSKDENFEFHLNSSGQIFWWWNTSGGAEDVFAATRTLTTTGAALATGNWYHVAIVYSRSGASQKIYVDGVERASATYSDVLAYTTDPLHIGGDQGFSGREFDGLIDEVKVFDAALSQADVATIMSEIRPCPGSIVDHYRILHDGVALTCQPESVTVQACGNTDCSVLYPGNATVTLLPTGWVGGDTQTFSGGQASFDLRRVTAGVASLGIGSATPLASNPLRCFNSGVEGDCNLSFHTAGFVFDVPDQVACTTSGNLAVAAVRADDASQQCVPAFANVTKPVSFWSTYVSPATPVNPAPVSVNGTAIPGASPGPLFNLAFDASGEAQITVAYAEAGQLELNAQHLGGGADAGLVMVGNDTFVYRPHSYFLGSTTDGVIDLNNATDTGDPRWPAGEDFRLQVRAQCQDGTITQNYVPSPVPPGAQLYVEMVDPTEAGGAAPGALTIDGSTFSGSFASLPGWHGISGLFGGGVIVTAPQDPTDPASYADASFSEVGVIRLHVKDDDYLGTSVPEQTLTVGRFHPYEFTVNLDNAPSFTPACGDFTYLEQPFNYTTAPQVTITAVNKAGATTQNYDGTWWKLADFTETVSQDAGIPLPGGVSVDDGLAGHSSFDCSTWTCDGSVSITFNGPLAYHKGGAPTEPFDGLIDVSFSVNDGDASYVSNPFVIQDIAFDDTDADASPNAGQWYGRLALSNGFGSELLPVAMPLTAQYFLGGGFRPNPADACTQLDLANHLLLSNPDTAGGTPQTGDTAMTVGAGTTSAGPDPLNFSAGRVDILFSPPGTGNTGYVDVEVDLGNLATSPPFWLEYDWDPAAAGIQGPRGRASFGIYRGSPNIIHMREPWN